SPWTACRSLSRSSGMLRLPARRDTRREPGAGQPCSPWLPCSDASPSVVDVSPRLNGRLRRRRSGTLSLGRRVLGLPTNLVLAGSQSDRAVLLVLQLCPRLVHVEDLAASATTSIRPEARMQALDVMVMARRLTVRKHDARLLT